MLTKNPAKQTLGIGDIGATVSEGGILKTMALGSCVAIMILDRRTRCIAMDHIALPDSSVSPDRAKQLPGYFADTGIPALLKEIQRVAGGISRPTDLIVKLAGGANVADPNNTFNIGKRNALAIKKILWHHGMGAIAEDLGANYSRTVEMFRDSGKIVLSCPGKGDWTL